MNNCNETRECKYWQESPEKIVLHILPHIYRTVQHLCAKVEKGKAYSKQ